jgi:colanic acid biosynthesis glycosyl transferase WcaI
VPAKPRGWQRVLSLLIFAILSSPVMVREMSRRPDIAFVIEPSFLDTVVCLFLARCFGRVCWLHIQDFEIDIAFELGQFRHRRIRTVMNRFESWVMRQFDVVSTISRRMLRRVEAKGVDPARSVFFPNWVDTGLIFPQAQASALRHELGIAADRVVALFSGTLGTKQSVETLIDVAMLLKDHDEIEFIICGNGAEALQARARGLANIRFLPLQPFDRLNDLLNLADIHLLPQKLKVADLVMPSKLINMVASGRPVVCGANPDTEIAEVGAQCGLVVEPENPEAMADAVLYLANNRRERIRLGEAARKYALRHLDHERILGNFEAFLYGYGSGGVDLLQTTAPLNGSAV